MKKLKLSTVFDGAFVFFISFFILYAMLKGLLVKIFLTMIVSTILSGFITFLFCVLMEKKISKKDILLKDKKDYDNFLKTLYFYSNSEVLKVIKSYYNNLGYKGIIKGNAYVIDEKKLYINFTFTPEKVALKTILSAYKKTPKGYDTVFIANEYDTYALEFFKGYEKVKLFSAKDFYLRLKEKELLPKRDLEEVKKVKIKYNFKSVFKRENSKKFLTWGIVFLLFSTVTFYKWFYAGIGVVFLIISSYLRFFKNFEQKENAELT
ncbi:MAG: hypothetical protein J6V66_00400 [Clostridia bacterium]|nr:hypothetical protein [Clostridia bacterium]